MVRGSSIMKVMHWRWIDSYSSSTILSSCAVFSAACGVHARERIERVAHHLRHLPAQMLHFTVLVRRPLHGGEPRGDVADLLALIADSLQIGDGLDDGDDDPQVARRGGAKRENPAALLVDRHLHAVDLVVLGRNRLAQAAVALDQGEDRLVQLLLHEAAHLQHLIAHLFQILVEAPGNVMGKIGRFHDGYLEVSNVSTRANTSVRLHPITPYVNSLRDNCDVTSVRATHALAAARTLRCQIRCGGK